MLQLQGRVVTQARALQIWHGTMQITVRVVLHRLLLVDAEAWLLLVVA